MFGQFFHQKSLYPPLFLRHQKPTVYLILYEILLHLSFEFIIRGDNIFLDKMKLTFISLSPHQ
jgi:hypothetical protein